MNASKTIGIVGCGTMGTGIAIVAARAGFKTRIYDVKAEPLANARQQAAAFLKKSVERGKLAAGEDPVVEAAIVKDLGNAYEQALPRLVQAALDVDLAGRDNLARLLKWLMLIAPSFSLRGGTPEVLRGIIAKGLGLR